MEWHRFVTYLWNDPRNCQSFCINYVGQGIKIIRWLFRNYAWKKIAPACALSLL